MICRSTLLLSSFWGLSNRDNVYPNTAIIRKVKMSSIALDQKPSFIFFYFFCFLFQLTIIFQSSWASTLFSSDTAFFLLLYLSSEWGQHQDGFFSIHKERWILESSKVQTSEQREDIHIKIVLLILLLL